MIKKIMIMLGLVALVLLSGCGKECVTYNGETACEGDIDYSMLKDLVKYRDSQPVRNITTDPVIGCYVDDVFVEDCSVEVVING